MMGMMDWWEGMMGDDEGQQANIGEWLAMVGDNEGCQKNGKWWSKGEGQWKNNGRMTWYNGGSWVYDKPTKKHIFQGMDER